MVGRIHLMFASSVVGPFWQRLQALGKVLLLVSALAGSACGQKGPLTLAPSQPAASGPTR